MRNVLALVPKQNVRGFSWKLEGKIHKRWSSDCADPSMRGVIGPQSFLEGGRESEVKMVEVTRAAHLQSTPSLLGKVSVIQDTKSAD